MRACVYSYKCAWCVYALFRGGYRVFQKGGLRPAIRNAEKGGWGGVGGGAVRFRPDTKSGGGGVLSASGPIRKAEGVGGGGGTVRRFRPDTKSGEVGGAV